MILEDIAVYKHKILNVSSLLHQFKKFIEEV